MQLYVREAQLHLGARIHTLVNEQHTRMRKLLQSQSTALDIKTLQASNGSRPKLDALIEVSSYKRERLDRGPLHRAVNLCDGV